MSALLLLTGSTETKTMQVQGRLSLEAQQGFLYELIDKNTNKSPKDLKAWRQGSDLYVSSDLLDVNIKIEKFWANCSEEYACSFRVDSPSVHGGELYDESFITQSSFEMDGLLAGRVGTLSEASAIGGGSSIKALGGVLLGVGLIGAAAGGGGGGGSSKGNTPTNDSGDSPSIPPVNEKLLPPNSLKLVVGVDGLLTVLGGAAPNSQLIVVFPDGKQGSVTADSNGKFSLQSEQPQPVGNVLSYTTKNGLNSDVVTAMYKAPDYKVSSSINLDQNNDGVISTAERGDTDSMDISFTIPQEAQSGDRITLIDQGGVVLSEVIVGDGANPGQQFVINVPLSQGSEAVDLTIKVSDSAGNSNEALISFDIEPQLQPIKFNIDSNQDGFINAAEKGANNTTSIDIEILPNAQNGDVYLITDEQGNVLGEYIVGENGVAAQSVQTIENVVLPNEGNRANYQLTVKNNNAELIVEQTYSVAVDTMAPVAAPASLTFNDDVNSDGYLNADELNGKSEITLTIDIPVDAVSGDRIVVANDNNEVIKEYIVGVGADEVLAGSSQTLVVPTLVENIATNFNVSVMDEAGNMGAVFNSQVTQDTGAPPESAMPQISMANTSDQVINANEKLLLDSDGDNVIAINVDIPVDASEGDVITITNNQNSTSAIFIVGQTATAGTSVSVDIPLAADGQLLEITTQLSDAAGNELPEKVTTYEMDFSGPGIASPELLINQSGNNILSDGIISGDERNGDSSKNLKVDLSQFKIGDQITISDGLTFSKTIVVDSANQTNGEIISLPLPVGNGSITLTAVTQDKNGNVGSPMGFPKTIVVNSQGPDINKVPVVSINESSVDIIADNFINTAEKNNQTTKTLTIDLSAFDIGDVITISSNNGFNETYTVNTANDIRTTNLTLPAADGVVELSVSTEDQYGNPGLTNQLLQSFTIDTDIADTLSLRFKDDANTDNWINATEDGGNTRSEIQLRLPNNGDKYQAGDVVTINDGNGHSVTYAITQTDIDNADGTTVWIDTGVSLPLVEGSAVTLTAGVSDAAGNSSNNFTSAATALDLTLSTAYALRFAEADGDQNALTKNDAVISGLEDSNNQSVVELFIPVDAATGDQVRVSYVDHNNTTNFLGAYKIKAGDTRGAWLSLPTSDVAEVPLVDGENVTLKGLVSDAALNSEILSDVMVAVDKAAPTASTATAVIEDSAVGFANDDVINVAEFNNATDNTELTVRVTVTTADVLASDQITLYANNTSGTVIATQNISDGMVSGLQTYLDFTIPMPADGAAIQNYVAEIRDQYGNANATITTQAVDRDTTIADTLAVRFRDDINVDGLISTSEDDNNSATDNTDLLNSEIQLRLPNTGAKYEADDVVTISDGNNHTVTYTIKQSDINNADGSVWINTGEVLPLVQGTAVTLTAVVSDTAGNSSTNFTSISTTLDSELSTSYRLRFAEADDDQNALTKNDAVISSLEDNNNQSALELYIPNDAVAGDVITVKYTPEGGSETTLGAYTVKASDVVIANQGNYIAIDVKDINNNSVDVPLVNLKDVTVSGSVSDAAGNSESVTGQAVIVDKTAPTATMSTAMTEDNAVGFANDNIININEYNNTADNTELTVRVTVTTSSVAQTDQISLFANNTNGSPLATQVVSAGTVDGLITYFDFTIAMPNDGATANYVAQIRDQYGNANATTTAQAVDRDTSIASAIDVRIKDANGDTWVNYNEANVDGHLNTSIFQFRLPYAAGIEAGDVIYFKQGSNTWQHTITSDNLLANNINQWIDVDTVTLSTATPITVTAVLKDAAGNESTTFSSDAVTLDLTKPTGGSFTVQGNNNVNHLSTINKAEVAAGAADKVNLDIVLPTDAVSGTVLIKNHAGNTLRTISIADFNSGAYTAINIDAPAHNEKLYVAFDVNDAAGNNYTVTREIKADLIGPTGGTLAIDGNSGRKDLLSISEANGGSVNVKVYLPTDTASGSITVGSIASGDDPNDPNDIVTVTLTSTHLNDGYVEVTNLTVPDHHETISVSFNVFDSAGNPYEAAVNATFPVKVDTVKPITIFTETMDVGNDPQNPIKDGYISALEKGAAETITLSIAIPDDANNGSIQITSGGTPLAPITFNNGSIAGTTIQQVVDLPEDGQKIIAEFVITDNAGNTHTGTQSLTMDTDVSPAAVEIVLDTAQTDTGDIVYINSTEKGAATTTQVTVSIPDNAQLGDTLEIKLDGTRLEPKYTIGSNAAAGDQITFSVNLPTEGNEVVLTTAFVDARGLGTRDTTHHIILDTTAPSGGALTTDGNAGDTAILSQPEIDYGDSGLVDLHITPPVDAVRGIISIEVNGVPNQTLDLAQELAKQDYIDNGYITVPDITPPANGQTITANFTVYDEAGNKYTQPRHVYVDTLPPSGGELHVDGNDESDADGKDLLSDAEIPSNGKIDIELRLPSDTATGTVKLYSGTTLLNIDLAADKKSGSIISGGGVAIDVADILQQPFAISDVPAPAHGETLRVVYDVADSEGNSTSIVRSITVDTEAPATTISDNLDTNNDGYISLSEKGAVTSIEFDINIPDDVKQGAITITVEGSTPQDFTVSRTDAGTLLIPKPSVTLPADTKTIDIDTTLIDLAGNTFTDTQRLTMDTGVTAMAVDIKLDSEPGGDKVYINSSEKGNDTATVIELTVPDDAQTGDQIILRRDGSQITFDYNGNTFSRALVVGTDIVAGSKITLSYDLPAENVDSVFTTSLIDARGNGTAVTSHTIHVDTQKPLGGQLDVEGNTSIKQWLNDAEIGVDNQINFTVSLPNDAASGTVEIWRDGNRIGNPYDISVFTDNGSGVFTKTFNDFTAPVEGQKLEVRFNIDDEAGNNYEHTEFVTVDRIGPIGGGFTVDDNGGNLERLSLAEIGVDNTVDLTITLPTDAVSGDIKVYSNGTLFDTYTVAQINADNTVSNVPANVDNSNITVVFEVSDEAGNPMLSPDNTHNVLIDRTIPTASFSVTDNSDTFTNILSESEIDVGTDNVIDIKINLATDTANIKASGTNNTVTIKNGNPADDVTYTVAQIKAMANTTIIGFNAPAHGNDLQVFFDVTDVADNPYKNIAAQVLNVDREGPLGALPVLTVNQSSVDIAADNYINAVEKGADTNKVLSVDLSQFTDGDIVTLTSNTGLNEVIMVSGSSDSRNFTLSLPATDDDIELRATSTDRYGNIALDNQLIKTITVDTQPPAAPAMLDMTVASDTGNSDSDNLSNDTTPSFAVTVPAGTTPSLYIDGVKVAASLVGNFLTPSTALTHGSYAITYTLTDAAGNESAESPALNVTIDIQAPTQTVTNTAGTYVNDVSASDANGVLQVTAENAASSEITFTGQSGNVVKTVNHNGSAQTVALTAAELNTLGEGVVTVSTVTTDAAGNASAADTSGGFIVDTVAPTTPVAIADLTAATDTGSSDSDNLSNDTTPSFAVTVPAGTTPSLYIDGVKVAASLVGNVLTPSTALTHGSYAITYTLTDAAGNESAESPALNVIIDTQAAAQTVTNTAGTYVNDVSASDVNGVLQVTAENTASSEITFTGQSGNVVKTVNHNGSAQTVTLTAAELDTLGEGAVTVSTVTTDAAGNASAADTTGGFIVDTVAPTTPVAIADLTEATDTGSSDSDNLSNNTTPSFAVTVPADTTPSLYIDGVKVAASLVGNVLTPSTALTHGSYAITYTLTDAAGNESAESPALNVTIDTQVVTPIVAPDMQAGSDTSYALAGGTTTDNYTKDTRPIFDIALPVNHTAKLYVDGSTVAATLIGGQLRPDVAITEGSHVITYTVIDSAGNESAASPALPIVVDTTGPTVNVVNTAGTLVNDVSASDADGLLSISGEAGSFTNIVFVGTNNSVTKTVTNTGSAQTIGLTATELDTLGEGTVNVQLNSFDKANNTTTETINAAFTVDTLAPTAIVASTFDYASVNDGYLNINAKNHFSFVNSDFKAAIMADSQVGDRLVYTVDGVEVASYTIGTDLTEVEVKHFNLEAYMVDGQSYEHTVTVYDAAGNQGASVTRDYIVDLTPPTVAPVFNFIQDSNNDGVISKDEWGSDTLLKVNVTIPGDLVDGGSVSFNRAGHTYSLTVDGTNYIAGNTYTYTFAQTPWAYTTNHGDSHTIDGVRTYDAALNDSGVFAGSHTITFDFEPPAYAITPVINAANGDAWINAAENTGATSVSITIPNGAEIGDVIKVTNVNTAQVIATYTVDAGTYAAGTTHTITNQTIPSDGNTLSIKTNVADQYGNTDTNADVTTTVTVDTTAPPQPSVVIDMDVNNDGNIVLAERTATGTPITVSFSGLVAGEIIKLQTGGSAYEAILSQADIDAGRYTFNNIPLPTSGNTLNIQVKTVDLAGNESAAAIDSAFIFADAPTAIANATTINYTNGNMLWTVSGTLSQALVTSGIAAEQVAVYDRGTFIGYATVTGTSWSIQDSRAHYATSSEFRAVVVSANGEGPSSGGTVSSSVNYYDRADLRNGSSIVMSYDYFGYDVATAGDFNGDGYEDFVGTSPESKRIVIFYGSESAIASVNNATFGGSNYTYYDYGTQWVGYSINSVGDINRDGKDDLVFTTLNGTLKVLYGGGGTTDLLTGLDSNANAVANYNVVGGDDFNNDGKVDVLVSSPAQNRGYVLWEGSSVGITSLIKSSGVLGDAIQSVGDINGDGIADFGIAASGAKKLYIIYGGSGLDQQGSFNFDYATSGTHTIASFYELGDNDGANINVTGNSQLFSAGDVNGDGIGDFVVSAPKNSTAFVVYGQQGGLSLTNLDASIKENQGFQITGATTLGSSVRGGYDVNGDGYDDIVIGARSSNRAYVIYGSANDSTNTTGNTKNVNVAILPNQPIFNSGALDSVNKGFRLTTNSTGGNLQEYGNAVTLGDWNGDGIGDIGVGNPKADTSAKVDTGSVDLVFGSTAGLTHAYSSGADVITATSNADRITGAQGNDIITNVSSLDVVYGAHGNDTIAVDTLDFRRIEGGLGIDTLRIDGTNLNVDFAELGYKAQHFEIIDLNGNNNSSYLRLSDALNLTDRSQDKLLIKGDNTNTVNLEGIWTDVTTSVAGSKTIDGITYNVYRTSQTSMIGNDLGDVWIQQGVNIVTRVVKSINIDLDTNNDGVINSTEKGAATQTPVSIVIPVGLNNGDYVRVSDGGGTVLADLFVGTTPGVISGSTYTLNVNLPSNGQSLVVNTQVYDGITHTPGVFIGDSALVLAVAPTSSANVLSISTNATSNILTGNVSSALTAGETLVIYDRGIAVGAATVDGSNNWSFVDGRELSGVKSTYWAYVENSNGNGPLGTYQVYTTPSGAQVTFDGSDGDNKSWDVTRAGDFNGDGYEDFVTSVAGDQSVYVVYGSASGLPTNYASSLSSISASDGKRFTFSDYSASQGYITQAAGDTNGDGYDDLIVHGHDNQSYILLGSNSAATVTIANATDLQASGIGARLTMPNSVYNSAVSAGDFNNDGLQDILVSNPLGSLSRGQGYVIWGASGGPVNISDLSTNSSVAKVTGQNTNSFFGKSFANIGDINNDGVDDFAIAGVSSSAADRGKVAIKYGSLDGTKPADYTVESSSSVIIEGPIDAVIGSRGSAYGDTGSNNYITSVGDMNGDGIDDFAIAAPQADANGKDGVGGAWVIYGKSGGLTNFTLSAGITEDKGFYIQNNQDAAYTILGSSIAGGGDINGDGFDDLVIGASGADRAWVIYGSANNAGNTGVNTRSVNVDLLGEKTQPANGYSDLSKGYAIPSGLDEFGDSVGMGDWNGDGLSDVSVGASQHGSSYAYLSTTESLTQSFTASDDTLAATAGVDRLSGGQGNDTITNIDTNDVAYGGQGNDTIAVTSTDFQRVDGGLGVDTLRLDGSNLTLDFSNLGKKAQNLEIIDLNGNNNQANLSLRDVFNLADTKNSDLGNKELMVKGDNTNTVDLAGSWTQDDEQSINGVTYSSYVSDVPHLSTSDFDVIWVQQGINVI